MSIGWIAGALVLSGVVGLATGRAWWTARQQEYQRTQISGPVLGGIAVLAIGFPLLGNFVIDHRAVASDLGVLQFGLTLGIVSLIAGGSVVYQTAFLLGDKIRVGTEYDGDSPKADQVERKRRWIPVLVAIHFSSLIGFLLALFASLFLLLGDEPSTDAVVARATTDRFTPSKALPRIGSTPKEVRTSWGTEASTRGKWLLYPMSESVLAFAFADGKLVEVREIAKERVDALE